jgi:NAD(P)-dependent dehydrogenase (short-subunit alcohol dehydrogenase family)
VFNAVRVATPSMVEQGRGGAIVMTSSTAGLVGVAAGDLPGVLGYTASKHGVIGLMRSWANSLAPHNIRVNVIAPSSVNTPMVVNGVTDVAMANDPTLAGGFGHALPVGLIEASDISNAVLFLVSDDGRYVSGTVLPVDAGSVNKR